MDGASKFQGRGPGLILTNSNDVIAENALHFSFKETDDQAKYEALLAGLKLAKELRAMNLRVFTDSSS